MLDHNLHLDTITSVDMPPPSRGRCHCRLASGQLMGSLQPVLASWHRRSRHERTQVIVRFQNGYGAIISEYHLLEGIYEIAPLRFHGPGPDDYEFHFRSHVPDLTWSSDRDEMVRVCEQISRLLPAAAV